MPHFETAQTLNVMLIIIFFYITAVIKHLFLINIMYAFSVIWQLDTRLGFLTCSHHQWCSELFHPWPSPLRPVVLLLSHSGSPGSIYLPPPVFVSCFGSEVSNKPFAHYPACQTYVITKAANNPRSHGPCPLLLNQPALPIRAFQISFLSPQRTPFI